MIKGALILAGGAAVGLVTGTLYGFLLGFRAAETITKTAEGPGNKTFTVDMTKPETA